MKPGDKPIYWHSLFIYFLNYQISWVDGCDIVKEQSAMKPLGKDDSLDCKTLMVENYQKCKFPSSFRSLPTYLRVCLSLFMVSWTDELWFRRQQRWRGRLEAGRLSQVRVLPKELVEQTCVAQMSIAAAVYRN